MDNNDKTHSMTLKVSQTILRYIFTPKLLFKERLEDYNDHDIYLNYLLTYHNQTRFFFRYFLLSRTFI